MNNEVITKVITFKDILYCCLYMNGKSCSYSIANTNMCMRDIIDVSDTTLKIGRKEINYKYFKKLNDTLVSFVYENNENPRIIGADATYIPLSIELKEAGFCVSKKDTYCIGLVSSLYDISNQTLINFRLHKEKDERGALLKQIKYLRKGDILVMDRGLFQ